MHKAVFYVAACNEVVGVFRDFYNIRPEDAPCFTCGIPIEFHLRLFKDRHSVEPYPLEKLSNVVRYAFFMDTDFDRTTPCKINISNDISVADVEESFIDKQTNISVTRHYTEFTIPIQSSDTIGLFDWLGTEKEKKLIGELVGYEESTDEFDKPVFVLQIHDFILGNRISRDGEE